MSAPTPQVVFVWGLKRSGTHLVSSWIYANLGGAARERLRTAGLPPALRDGFEDPSTAVAFFNNCGRFHCRSFELGPLQSADFERAAQGRRAVVFGIEDCRLGHAARTNDLPRVASVLVLRDPLNNLASRLKAATVHPEQFRVDEAYVDLMQDYCAEFLGRTTALPGRITLAYDRFVVDRRERDRVAEALGVRNVDRIDEVSSYGGGSSFSASRAPSAPDALLNRYREHPLPGDLLEMILDRPAIREVCTTVFGYDLSVKVREL